MKIASFVLLCFLLIFPDVGSASEIIIFGTDNNEPVFSETTVDLLFESNAALNIVDDDAIFATGGSTIILDSGSKINVSNTISEGVGIHILAAENSASNAIHLKTGASIQVTTSSDSPELTYSEIQGGRFVQPWQPPPVIALTIDQTSDSLVTSGIEVPGLESAVNYDEWEVNNPIESFMIYPDAVARGIVLEGVNTYIPEDETLQLIHTINLNDASISVSASSTCDGGWAEARGVDVNLPEVSNSLVELSLNNSHIKAVANSTGGIRYYDNYYVYGESGAVPSSSNSVGVYASSDMVINIDSTSSISGDWAVWGSQGTCVGWYYG